MRWHRRDAAGPGEAQAIDARRSRIAGMFADPVRNTGVAGRPSRIARGELMNPQGERPEGERLQFSMQDANVSIDASLGLPGRVTPTAWDGEPGYTAPNDGV